MTVPRDLKVPLGAYVRGCAKYTKQLLDCQTKLAYVSSDPPTLALLGFESPAQRSRRKAASLTRAPWHLEAVGSALGGEIAECTGGRHKQAGSEIAEGHGTCSTAH